MISEANPPITFVHDLDSILRSMEGRQEPEWLMNFRRESLARLNEIGFPTTKHEDWKYTNFEQIKKHKFHLVHNGQIAASASLAPYSKIGEIILVFVNGRFSKDMSKIPAQAGLTVKTLTDAVSSEGQNFKQAIGRYKATESSSFVALNHVLNLDGSFIKIAKNAVIKPLIQIIHLTDALDKEILTSPRTCIFAEKSSEATILESHLSTSDQSVYFSNALTDIFVEENANLNYCKAQKESMKAFHIGQTRIWQERDSNFSGFSFMIGAKLARNNLDVILNAEGANCNLKGLYNLTDHQFTDNHTSIEHRFPNGTSNQLYKGILKDSSHAVFNGKIYVHAIAQKTNSYQLNKNLLLGEKCSVDTKPQLEIFADDVKCTHGATIGQINEDEIFYLQTRSIPFKQAVAMLAKGFIDDLLDTLPNPAIIQKLNALLESSPIK